MHLHTIQMEMALEPFQLEIAPSLKGMNDVELVCHAALA
jgi:hypothetical protein